MKAVLVVRYYKMDIAKDLFIIFLNNQCNLWLNLHSSEDFFYLLFSNIF